LPKKPVNAARDIPVIGRNQVRDIIAAPGILRHQVCFSSLDPEIGHQNLQSLPIAANCLGNPRNLQNRDNTGEQTARSKDNNIGSGNILQNLLGNLGF